MASLCRWELPLHKVLQTWGGMVTHFNMIIFILVFCLFKSLPAEHKDCNHNFSDLGVNEATQGKTLLPPYILKSSRCKPLHSHLDLFSQRSHYWQHSPFSLTLPWMFLNLLFFHLQPKTDLKSKPWFHLNMTILIPLDDYCSLDCFKASLSNWMWIKRK